MLSERWAGLVAGMKLLPPFTSRDGLSTEVPPEPVASPSGTPGES